MRKNMILIFCAIFALAASTLACSVNLPVGGLIVGNGKVVTETRQVSDFSAVSVCCGMDLVLSQGARESLELEMEENILPNIETIVQGSTLVVRIKDDHLTGFSATKPMIVRLTMIDINEIDISGGGQVESAAIETDSLELDLSGGSRAAIGSLSAGSFTADLSGGSNLAVSGETDRLTLDMSGGGDGDLGDLACRRASIDLSGGASAIIWVTDALSANLSGGSNLAYYGSPTLESVNISGGSGMNSRGEK